jgi:thiol-disulfide isomerase/thioredoxin
MRKLLVVLLEAICALPLVAVGLGGADVLLQSPSLAYLLFPLLTVAAAALGFWRGRASALASWQVATLIDLPLLLVVLWFLSQRAWSLLALPLLGMTFAALGIAAARSARTAPRGRRWAIVLVPLLAVNFVLLLGLQRFVSSLVVSREVREPAPLYRLALLAGGTMDARQLRGRVVVLDFWATWCGPCRRELPELEQIYERFAKRPDVAFYAVDAARGDTPEQARRFFHQHGYRLALAYDRAEEVQKLLAVSGLPSLLVLDRAGRIRLRHVGFVGAENLTGKLTSLIDTLLAESPEA